MKRIIAILFIFATCLTYAQQDALYSQYTYNQFSINPAYAGSRNSFSGVLFHRSQWVGIKDAPTIESFTIHSPLNTTSLSSLAYGVNVSSEKLGPFTNNALALSLTYHISLKKSKLSFALRGGIYHSIFEKDLLTFKDKGDVFNVGSRESSLIPNFDFGTYYYTSRFFVGLSITHINNSRLEFKDYPSANSLFLVPHVYLHSGYVFNLGEKVKFKPTMLLKLSEGASPNIDLGVNFMFLKKFWLGVSFRNESSINFLTEWNITDFLRIGYAYDYSTNKLAEYNKGSHEIFLGFDFSLKGSKNKKLISPRYL